MYMTIKFAKRVASDLLHRGSSSIRISSASLEDAEKAITRDDVRRLIKSGGIFALKAKHNASSRSKILKEKRAEGRRRGIGRRRGTRQARRGISWEKKVRSQRTFLKKLKELQKLDTATFNTLYGQVKGNVYANKAALVIHLRDQGIVITDEEIKKINEEISKQYR